MHIHLQIGFDTAENEPSRASESRVSEMAVLGCMFAPTRNNDLASLLATRLAAARRAAGKTKAELRAVLFRDFAVSDGSAFSRQTFSIRTRLLATSDKKRM